MIFPHDFKIFDPHLLDMHGMPSACAYSVLISVQGLLNLVNFFRHSQNSNNLFELKGFKCHKNNKPSSDLAVDIFENKCNKLTE